ncbi:fibroin heavy chain-like [Nerophis ophidion]|uniref:fibroin heavy chain-like n=1 Tax=Nerophis ophidion TaxID=159077 RepID=UPI002AE06917|nr:fibroin heavy chain-like [Nerophis ophidion]
MPNTGYGQIPYGKGPKLPGAPDGRGLKGDVLSPQQPRSAPQEGAAPQRPIIRGDMLPAPEPTNGGLVLVTQDQYQRLPSPVPQGKSYKQLMPQGFPEQIPAFPQGKESKLGEHPNTGSTFPGSQDKSLKAAPPAGVHNPAVETPGALPQGYVIDSTGPKQKSAEADVFGVGNSEGDAVPQDITQAAPTSFENTLLERAQRVYTPPEEGVKHLEPEEGPDKLGVKEYGGASNSKGQGAKATKPDCGPGGANGQWMKIPRPGPEASAGTNTKGYGTGGYTGPRNGYAAGLGYPFGGKPQQPIYRQGAYLGGPGYGKGNYYAGNAGPGEGVNSKAGYPNGYGAGLQPDYASLGYGIPTADAKSGGGMQVPYNGAPAVPAGLNGASQTEPQSAGLGPSRKQGPVHGGMDGLPYGVQTGMGAENSNAKYGIGGLQFGGNPLAGNDGGGNYGGAGMGGFPYGYGGFPNLLGFGSNGNIAGKYGYGRMPHEAQPVGFVPQVQSPGAGIYGPAGSPYQSGAVGFAPRGGDGYYVPQGAELGSEGKPAGKYDNQGVPISQSLESASESQSGPPYEAQPDTSANTNVESVPAQADTGMATKYENVGYISGSKLQPEVVSLPAAPTPGPILESALTPAGTDDLSSDLTGPGGLIYDSAGVGDKQARGSEHPDDAEQLPRQIHIQQHLKLHFHPKGTKDANHDLNGFFGNSGYKG